MKKEDKITRPTEALENPSDESEITDEDLEQVSGGAKSSHINFDGVDGESSHKDHKGEIEILSW